MLFLKRGYPRLNFASPQSQGLYALWSTLAGPAGTLPDLRGHAHFSFTGAATDPAWTPDTELGQGLLFVAGSSEYLSGSADTIFDGADATTSISLWFRVTGSSAAGYIVSKGIGAANPNKYGWGFYYWNTGQQIVYNAKDAGNNNTVQRISTSTVNDNAWHHLLIVQTLDTVVGANNAVDIYLDGVLDQGAQTGNSNAYFASTATVELGRRIGGLYFSGDLADIRFYLGDISYLAPALCDPATRWDIYKGPTILYYAGPGTTTVQLDWTDVSENEDGFSIERAEDAGAFAEIDTVGAGVETYDDLLLPTGHTYHYRVRATSATLGYSEYSNEADVTV